MPSRYFPHTDDDRRAMLAAVGAGSVDELFADVPPDARRDTAKDFPGPFDEWTLRRRLEDMAGRAGGDWRVFVGAGSQPHAVPAIVPALAGRGEFLTAYTPYQPEISQGTLQAMFEFQTLVARLAGLEIANASLYDGATALAEAALMAQRITKRHHLAISALVHPHWREVLDTYLAPFGDTVRVSVLPPGADGRTDFSALEKLPGVGEGGDEAPAALLAQSPNFLGVVEDLAPAAEIIHRKGGLLAAGFSEPYALGLFRSPGEMGADIVFGEGQSFGLPQGFGGPGLGLLAARREYMRQIPGRLVGRAVDREGRPGFVLTLAAREQHIRRGRAVSNICSNAGHAALTAAIHMAALGRSGLRDIARLNRDLAEYFKGGLLRAGFRLLAENPAAGGGPATFNEFALRAPAGFAEKHRELCSRKTLAGLPLPGFYPADPFFADAWLFGVTETKTRADIDDLLARV